VTGLGFFDTLAPLLAVVDHALIRAASMLDEKFALALSSKCLTPQEFLTYTKVGVVGLPKVALCLLR
jgi:hypothetical protein